MQRELSLSQKKRSAHRIVLDNTNCTLLQRQRDLCFREQSLAVGIGKSFGTFNTALLQVPICRAWKLNIENMEFQMKFRWEIHQWQAYTTTTFWWVIRDLLPGSCGTFSFATCSQTRTQNKGKLSTDNLNYTHTIYGNVMMNIFGK